MPAQQPVQNPVAELKLLGPFLETQLEATATARWQATEGGRTA